MEAIHTPTKINKLYFVHALYFVVEVFERHHLVSWEIFREFILLDLSTILYCYACNFGRVDVGDHLSRVVHHFGKVKNNVVLVDI